MKIQLWAPRIRICDILGSFLKRLTFKGLLIGEKSAENSETWPPGRPVRPSGTHVRPSGCQVSALALGLSVRLDIY